MFTMTMTMRAESPSKLTQRPLYALLAFPPGLAWLNCITRGKHIIYFQRPFKFQWSFTEEIFSFDICCPPLPAPIFIICLASNVKVTLQTSYLSKNLRNRNFLPQKFTQKKRKSRQKRIRDKIA